MEKSRKNRKVMAIVAMVLMVCLILAMGAVTFAKYITSGTTGDQTATAAKWGFVVTVNADNLFATDYSVADSGTLATKATGEGVAINADSIVVAPGSTGSMTITISGSADTLAKLTIADEGTPSEIHFGDYYPVKWTLKDGDTTVGTANSQLAEVIASLETSQYFDAGTDYAKSYTLTWEWAFEGAEENANVKDTIIGYKAMGKAFNDIKDVFVGSTQISAVCANQEAFEGIVSTLSFKLNVSIEQAQIKA